MSYYGYNPSDYIQDFSWVGDIGKAISQTALKMPQLIELNKQIKENNKFKDMAWDASNRYIDQLDIDKASNILSSMGIDFENEVEAKDKLKSLIPQYSEKMTNEEYAKEVSNGFFVPFLQAAQSQKGGGQITFGQLFGNLNSGQLQEQIRSSSVGQELTADEAEAKRRKRKIAYQEEDFAREQEQELGFKPTGLGYLKDRAGVESTIEDKRKKELTGISAKEGTLIGGAAEQSQTPEEAYSKVVQSGGSKEDAKEAANMVEERLARKFREKELRKKYTNSRNLKEKLPKIEPKIIPNMVKEATSVLSSVIKDLESIKELRKNDSVSKSEAVELTEALKTQQEEAITSLKMLRKAHGVNLRSGGKTAEDAQKALSIVEKTKGLEEEEIAKVEENQPKKTEWEKLTSWLVGQSYSSMLDKYDADELTLIGEVKKQIQKYGKVTDAAKRELSPIAKRKGVTVDELILTLGGSGDMKETVDWKAEAKKKELIRAARETLKKPNEPKWETPKKNAKELLKRMGLSE